MTKNLMPAVVAAIAAGSLISSAYALGGVNISVLNGTSLFADQNLHINLNSLQLEHIELRK